MPQELGEPVKTQSQAQKRGGTYEGPKVWGENACGGTLSLSDRRYSRGTRQMGPARPGVPPRLGERFTKYSRSRISEGATHGRTLKTPGRDSKPTPSERFATHPSTTQHRVNHMVT